MTQQTKGPATAPTVPSRVHLTPPKGKKNMDIYSMSDQEAASIKRVRFLAKEISEELNNVPSDRLVIIFPSSTNAYPVQICLEGEFAELLQAVVTLRKERREGAVTCK
ncbi:hypothetical protein ACI2JN_07510 [Ochrobactrum teleogrylli]|uniref:hypothetical protein n=1 Tax=Ochrobactrum teleogrylli TaxID=2479765 RepID=UPI00384FA8F5